MPKLRSVQVFKDRGSAVESLIVQAIGQVGPRNIAELSRLTRVHQETIRYKVKNGFGGNGFRFHADVDLERIGLTPHWAELQLTPRTSSRATGFLRALNRSGYLVYYGKLIPSGSFTALLALPSRTAKSYLDIFKKLRSLGLVREFSLKRSLAAAHHKMNPEFFNFKEGSWEVEWPRILSRPADPLKRQVDPVAQKLDITDLLILKELQIDALQHISGIGRKLKMSQKTLEYHFRNHVQKGGLISQYRVRWTTDIGSTLAHSHALIRLKAGKLRDGELRRLQGAVSKIPFLWNEDLTEDGTYFASLYVPLVDQTEMMAYLDEAAPGLADKLSIQFVRAGDASSFTIPYNMWNEEDGWNLDPEKLTKEAISALSS